jgi:hypothetical protein
VIAVRSGENNDAKFHRNPQVNYMEVVVFTSNQDLLES